LRLKLIGRKSNRAAIGARIKVTVKENNKLRVIYKTISSGGSFGANPLRAEIGLGKATSIQQVEIQWPSKHTQAQVQKGLQLDKSYEITENSSQPHN
jgi:hypothetical protein